MNMVIGNTVGVSLSVYNERLAIVLGILTLFSILTVFLSCRICLKLLKQIGLQKLIAHKNYQQFLKFHTYYWWLFWLIFVIHLMAAIMHLGFKNSGDPDAYLHKYSVIFGALALLLILAVNFSCIGINKLGRLFSDRKPSDYKVIGRIYRYHGYYWIFFFLLIASHFTVGSLHSGWWPG